MTDDGPLRVRSAFLVFQRENGAWEATPNIDAPLMPEHPASVPEMKHGCFEVLGDIQTSEASAAVVQQMMAITARLNEQASTQALREKLKI
ncbi:hypothetical protein ACFVGM_08630 [Kitasatospora purpeofusca]|uniref:hypothetical protein n=1 Tax=Kitasatospora purpeofusca TaxID=67352 RepID=UPI0036AE4BE6